MDSPRIVPCEACATEGRVIGMIEHGCYCKAVGAVGPGGPLPSKDQQETDHLKHARAL